MTGFFSWLQITALSYLAQAILASPEPLGSAVIPWWYCGAMVALCYIVNYILAGCKLVGTRLIALNAISFVVLNVLPVFLFQFSVTGRIWPSTFPGVIIFLAVWFCLSYSFWETPAVKTKVWLWETGILTGSFGIFLAVHSNLDIPYAGLIPLVVLFSGLAGQGLRKTEESAGVVRSNNRPRANTLAGIFLLLTIFISIFSILGLVLQRVIGNTGWETLQKLIAWYKTLAQCEGKKHNPLLDYFNLSGQQAASLSGNGYGSQAPFWFMCILWTLLALVVLLAFIVFLWKLREFYLTLKELNLKTANRSSPANFASLWLNIKKHAGHLAASVRKTMAGLKRLLIFYMNIPPANLQALFSYYLRWGRYIGLKKYSYETPREYLSRLRDELEESRPELTSGLVLLTSAHEIQYYGQTKAPLTSEEIKKIFHLLSRNKSLKKTFRRTFRSALIAWQQKH